MGIFALELPMSEAPELFVQLLVEPTCRARAKTVSAELFADRFDLPGRYSLMDISRTGKTAPMSAIR